MRDAAGNPQRKQSSLRRLLRCVALCGRTLLPRRRPLRAAALVCAVALAGAALLIVGYAFGALALRFSVPVSVPVSALGASTSPSGAVSTAASASVPPQRAFALWQWGSRVQISPADAAALRAAGCDAVWRWVALIEAPSGVLQRRRRGGALLGLDDLPCTAVVRIDVSCTPWLTRDGGRELFPLVLGAIPGQRDDIQGAMPVEDGLPGEAGTRVAGSDVPPAPIPARPGTAGVPSIVGLQLDWDVPTRQLPQYAAFLRELRRQLPQGLSLSCTTLASAVLSRDFAELADAVDVVVPQAYAYGPPAADATRVVGAEGRGLRSVDLVRRLGALGRPHRVGLATYEQTVIHAADGSLRSIAAPISAEELLESGLRLLGVRRAPERFLDLRCDAAVTVGSVSLLSGDAVRCAQPQATALAEEIAAVRAAAGPGFQGLSIFRVSAARDLPAFPAPRLARTLSGTALPAKLERELVAHSDGTWRLHLRNAGDDDLVAAPSATTASAMHVIDLADAHAFATFATPGVQIRATRQGELCSPAHADGCRIVVHFLRAGGQFSLLVQPFDRRASLRLLTE